MQHSEGFLKLVELAKKNVKELPAEEVLKELGQNPKHVLIDVREDAEWAQGHLPKAIHLSKGIIERDIEQRFPDRDTPLVLYCGGGYRSILAAESLQKMGYRKVLSMIGGYRGWLEKNFPIEHESD